MMRGKYAACGTLAGMAALTACAMFVEPAAAQLPPSAAIVAPVGLPAPGITPCCPNCLCVPNAKCFGYFTTRWRAWPCELPPGYPLRGHNGAEPIPAPVPEAGETPPPPAPEASPQNAIVPAKLTSYAAPPAERTADAPAAGAPGLNGYCPVDLVDRRAWRSGKTQWAAVHEGRTYHFSGPEQLERFRATPERYAPALGGLDLVVLTDERRPVPGRVEDFQIYQGRLYLFASGASLARFLENPQRYALATAPARNAKP